MNYCELLFYPDKLEVIIEGSDSPAKTQYLELLTESIEFLKADPELWRWDAMHFHFENIQMNASRNVIADIDEQLTDITDFVAERKGNLISNTISDDLLDVYCTSDECAVYCVKYCIDGLSTSNLEIENLVLAAKLNQQMKVSSLIQYVLDVGEDTAFANKQSAKKGNKAKLEKIKNDPVIQFSQQFAKSLWQEDDSLNVSAVAKLCLYALNRLYEMFTEDGCLKFIEFGAYHEKALTDFDEQRDSYLGQVEKDKAYYQTTFAHHPDNREVICIPCEIPTFATLRNHLGSLEPTSTKKRINNYYDYEERVEAIIACHSNECPCMN